MMCLYRKLEIILNSRPGLKAIYPRDLRVLPYIDGFAISQKVIRSFSDQKFCSFYRSPCGEVDLLGSALSQSSLTLYLDLNTSIHMLWLPKTTIHANLARSASFISFVFLNPRPPTHLGLQSLSHSFHAIKLPSFLLGCHQNLLARASNLSQFLTGILKADKE